MKFKQYLQKQTLLEKDNSSNHIIIYLNRTSIPLSPKFFEELFGHTEHICFRSIRPTKTEAESLYKRQKRKNQVSTFTQFNSNEIFYGATGLTWYDEYNYVSSIAVLKGKVTFRGDTDLYTAFEKSGRQWINPSGISKKSKIRPILLQIQKEIKQELTKYYKNFELEELSTQSNDTKQRVIKHYFDISYKILKKHKNEIQKIREIDQEESYNEVMCYSYTVEKLFVVYENENELQDYKETNLGKIYFEYLKNKNYETIKTSELQKVLKKYK